jgi:hypothetical protein
LHFHILHLLVIVSQGSDKEVNGFPKKQGCSSYHLPLIKRKKCKINPKVASFIKFKDLFQFFFLLGIIKKKGKKNLQAFQKTRCLQNPQTTKEKVLWVTYPPITL